MLSLGHPLEIQDAIVIHFIRLHVVQSRFPVKIGHLNPEARAGAANATIIKLVPMECQECPAPGIFQELIWSSLFLEPEHMESRRGGETVYTTELPLNRIWPVLRVAKCAPTTTTSFNGEILLSCFLHQYDVSVCVSCLVECVFHRNLPNQCQNQYFTGWSK